MPITAPAFEDTTEAQAPLIPPAFEDTQEAEAPLSPPAFEDTQEIVESKESQPLSDIGRQFVASVAKSTIDPLLMASRIGSKLPAGKLSETVSGITGAPSSEEILTEMEGASARAGDEYGVNPKFQDTFLSNVARGFGQIVPAVAAGRAAPIVSALMSGEQGYQEAKSFGATGTKLIAATGINATTAFVTEKLMGIPKILGLIKGSKAVPKSIIKTALKSAKFEVGQELIEQVMQDLSAKGLYDPDRKVFDWKKLATVAGVAALVGGGTGGTLQAAANLSVPKSTGVIDPKTVAPKEQVQEVAKAVDESLAQLATEEPPAAPPAQEPPQATEPAPVQPTTPEPTPAEAPAGPRIVSTGIMTPEGIATFGNWNTKHADIIKNSEVVAQALDAGMDIDQLDANKGFIVEENGKQRFVGRKEALEIARKSGQVDESVLYSPEKQGLISEALIEPQNAQAIRSNEGQIPPGGDVLRPSAEQSGGNLQQQTPGTPDVQQAQSKVSPEEAAVALQPYRDQAIDAARKAGATDPELAASIAQQQTAEKGNQDPALFIETARRRGLDQQRGTQPTTPVETAPEATVERGPRAETISQEDVQSLDEAVNQLPEVQRNIIRELESNPDLTDQGVASALNLTIDQVKKAKIAFRKTMREFIQSQGIGARLGPGAANVEETLAQYEERKFGKRFQETEGIAPEIKEATGNRYYEIIPNRVTAERATEIIDKNGEQNAEEQIRDESSGLSYADRSTVGQILIKRYNDQYKSLKNTNPEEASRVLDKVSNLAEWASDYGTRLGQGVQSFAMWMRLTPEGKLRTFQKMVRKKRDQFTRDNRNDIDEIKDIVNGEGTLDQKAEKIRKLKNPTAKKVRKKARDLVKDGPLTDEKFHTLTAEELGLPVFDQDVQNEILRLAEIADNAPEGMPKMEATLELNKFIARQKGFDPSDLLFGIYYGNILSGGWTQAINFIDTALNVQNEIAVLAIQNPKAAAEIASAMAKGASMGKYDSLMAIMKGRRISDGKFVEDPFFMETAQFGKKGGVPIKQDTRIGRVAKRLAESKVATPLNLYKYIGRVMSASDALAFRSAMEAKSAQLAFKIANDNDSSVDKILGYDRIPEFREQAKSEGYTGYQAEARANELMMMSRPAELQKASRDFASDATYNVRPYGLMGSISNGIESITRDYKIGKLVVPFTRIVANVVNRGMNNSPYGYVNAIRGKAGHGRSTRVFSPEERNAMLIRASVATTLMATVVALHESGAITIHGAGPNDPEKKRQLRQTGWKPYTIQIGDRYISYNYTPWGLMMAATGNWLDNAKYKDFSSQEGFDKLTYSVQSVASTVFNQSFLSGLSGLFDVISGRSSAIPAGRRFVSSTVTGLTVPFSSAAKDVESLVSDPNVPKVENMRQAIIANIPFASQGLKPQLNAFGEPIKSQRNRLFSSSTDDPVWRAVAERGWRIPVPNAFFDNPEDQYGYHKEQGKMLRKWMEQNLPRLKNMDQKHAQDAIENASDQFRMRTRNRMLREGSKKKQK